MSDDFDFPAIGKVLKEITDQHISSEKFIAAIYEDHVVEIRFKNLEGIDTFFPALYTYADAQNNNIEIAIKYTAGPEIKQLLGDVEKDPYIEIKDDTVLGGDHVRNVNDMGHFGTISFFCSSISIAVKTPSGTKKCDTNNALVSNNHVIGRSDRGTKGEKIWTYAVNDIAELHCTIPFKSDPDIDISTASTLRSEKKQNWKIREIGMLKDIKLPKNKEAIRKYGARTGLTSGTVKGIANIVIGRILFNGVFVTSNGFSCGGDSGSTVVNSNNDLVGILSWGDDIPCEQRPRGYFFSFLNPKGLRSEEEFVEVIIEQ